MVFLSTPDIEALYSGDAMIKPSAAWSLSCRARAPSGRPVVISMSWSYGGHWKSDIVDRSTDPPFCSTIAEARVASLSFIEPERIDAPNTRNFTEHRFVSSMASSCASALIARVVCCDPPHSKQFAHL